MKIEDFKKELAHKMRKTPNFIEDFERLIALKIGKKESFEEIKDKSISKQDIDYSFNVLNKFNENKNLFKNLGLSIKGKKVISKSIDKDYIEWKSLEQFDDHMTYEIYRSKVLKYQNSILREKKELADENSFEKFSVLFDLEIDKEKVSNELKKISAWSESEQLNNTLDKIIELFNKKTIDDYIKDANENKNCEIIYSKNNILVLDIKDFNTSKKFGSNQWCISYDEKNWDDYLYEIGESDSYYNKVEENKNFFVIDFNKNPDHYLHKFAFTTLPSSKIIYAHDKNDSDIMDIIESLPEFLLIRESLGNYFYNEFKNNKLKTINDNFDSLEEIAFDRDNQIIYLEKQLLELENTDYEENYYANIDNETKNVFNEIINEFCKTAFCESLFINGDKETIKSLFVLNEKIGSNISFNITKSFNNFDLMEIKDHIKRRPENILMPIKDITGIKEKPYNKEKSITENYINTLFDLKSNFIVGDVFNIMLCKKWENENFVIEKIEKEYTRLSSSEKVKLLKNINNMPPENASLILKKFDNDNLFNIKENEFFYQNLFEMATSEMFSTGEFSEYKNVIKVINHRIKERSDSYIGNGLYLHNIKKMGIYEKQGSSFSRIENIIKNNVIKIDKLETFINEMEKKSLTSPFSGIDQIILKNKGYKNYIDYFNDNHKKNKVTLKI